MEASPDQPKRCPRRTPRAVRRSHYGYKKISDALTYEANSLIALCSMRPKAVVYSFSHHVQHWCISSMVPFVAVTHNDHMGAVLSHRKRREGGTCNYLVKVKMKQLSVQGALNNTSAISINNDCFVRPSLCPIRENQYYISI